VNTLDMSTPAIGSGSYLSRAQPIGRFAYPLRSSFNAGMPTLTRKRGRSLISFADLIVINAIAIANEVLWGLIPGKSLRYLVQPILPSGLL